MILFSPVLLVTRARKIIEKLLSRHAGLILHDLVFLQAPGNARRLGEKLADIVTVRTDYFVLVRKSAFQI
jgi:hypothetical protein